VGGATRFGGSPSTRGPAARTSETSRFNAARANGPFHPRLGREDQDPGAVARSAKGAGQRVAPGRFAGWLTPAPMALGGTGGRVFLGLSAQAWLSPVVGRSGPRSGPRGGPRGGRGVGAGGARGGLSVLDELCGWLSQGVAGPRLACWAGGWGGERRCGQPSPGNLQTLTVVSRPPAKKIASRLFGR
jgi:hypothetical protein